MGAMLDVLGMLVLTIPFIFPVVIELGIDPVWFGVFVVIMAELALITPPIGANVFIMRRVPPDVALADTFRGVFPFDIGHLMPELPQCHLVILSKALLSLVQKQKRVV